LNFYLFAVLSEGIWPPYLKTCVEIIATDQNNMAGDETSDEIHQTLGKMTASITDPQVQWDGFDELCRLAYNSAENQEIISKAGGLSLIARSMKEHCDNPTVQASGCLCLANLSHDFSLNDQLIAIEGGIGAILAAMKAHKKIPEVQKCACMAIRNLCFTCSENRVLISRAGGISLVMKALKKHVAHAEVQAEGCAALGNLALNSENKSKIVKAGGIEACTMARTLFQNVEETKLPASGALWRLGFVQGTAKDAAEEFEELEPMEYGPYQE